MMGQRVVIYSIYPDMEAVYTAAAIGAEFEAEPVSSHQEFSSQLYRDADAIGVLWAFGAVSAAETVRRIRQGNVTNRIIALLHEDGGPSRRSADRAMVLVAGADDCQPSDIDHRELSARLKAIAERGAYIDHLRIAFLDCTYLDAKKLIISPRGNVRIGPKEGDILREIARRPDQVVSKADLMKYLYPGEDVPEDKIIDVMLTRLRSNIMRATGGLDVVRTHWGRGIQFEPAGFVPKRHAWQREQDRRLGSAKAVAS